MYSIPQYLKRLKQAKRSPGTIRLYTHVLNEFSRFCDVPVDEMHLHLDPDHLIRYAEGNARLAPKSLRMRISIIQRFYSLNGIQFDELEVNVLKPRNVQEQDDKPLDLATLQKMMDLGDVHAKALLSTLISTGMRAGECCQLLLSDVKGDTIHIRNEIAKGGRGGTVYLTKEAQDYLALWLKDRDRYMIRAKTKNYSRGTANEDKRLFGISYRTLWRIFSLLYDKVDGEKGRYWSRCTIHSCRKYFRTHAVKTMSLDLVEKLLRHSGYLTGSYVRISAEDARREFHSGESALYITRRDQRATDNAITVLKEENRAARLLEERVILMEKHITELMKKG